MTNPFKVGDLIQICGTFSDNASLHLGMIGMIRETSVYNIAVEFYKNIHGHSLGGILEKDSLRGWNISRTDFYKIKGIKNTDYNPVLEKIKKLELDYKIRRKGIANVSKKTNKNPTIPTRISLREGISHELEPTIWRTLPYSPTSPFFRYPVFTEDT